MSGLTPMEYMWWVLAIVGGIYLFNIFRENGAKILNATIRGGIFIGVGVAILYFAPEAVRYIDRNLSDIFQVNRYLPRSLRFDSYFRPFEVLIIVVAAASFVGMGVALFLKSLSGIFKR